jgi:hypothetical protein
MAGSDKVGRQGSTGVFTNTIAPKSAEQAMLMKMDEMIDRLNALRAALETAADTAAINTAAAALADLEKVKLVR